MCSLNILVKKTNSGALKSRRMILAGHGARLGGEERLYRILMGKPGGKRQLGIPRSRWEYNIKMDIQEVEFGVVG
jgi:hypothetical protein